MIQNKHNITLLGFLSLFHVLIRVIRVNLWLDSLSLLFPPISPSGWAFDFLCEAVGRDASVGSPSGARSATEVATGARTASRRGRSWDNCRIRMTASQARSNFFQPAL